MKRAVGYFRVSSEEQVDGYSLAAQERAYRQYVEANGYTSVAEYRDEGISARTDNIKKRPEFAQMLDDAEAGLFDVIVVHKLDRFSRSMQVTLQAFEILGRANVGLVSISESNLDYSSPTGKLTVHLFAMLGQFYSDNLSAETKKGKTERRRQGIYNGPLPFGVTKGPDGLPVPDQTIRDNGKSNYDGLLLIFNQAAQGRTCRQIAQELNSLGFRTVGNRGGTSNVFGKDNVVAILRNRFYIGELPDGEYPKGQSRRGHYTKHFEGKHGQIVPVELWEAARQEQDRKNPSLGARTHYKARIYSLSGVLECGYCGSKMHFLTNRRGQLRTYCYGRKQGNGCMQPHLLLTLIEQQFSEYLQKIKIPENYHELILDAGKNGDNNDSEKLDNEKQRQLLTGKLERLKNLYVEGELDRKEYEAKRDKIRIELAGITKTPANTHVSYTSEAEKLERLASYLENIGAAWEEKSVTNEGRNQLASTLFKKIVVKDRDLIEFVPQTGFKPLLDLLI